VDNSEIRIETLARKREGMQPVTVWNDIRVTHLKTGIAVEIPHEFRRSQNGNLKVALAMLDAAINSGSLVSQENFDLLPCRECGCEGFRVPQPPHWMMFYRRCKRCGFEVSAETPSLADAEWNKQEPKKTNLVRERKDWKLEGER
jgi:hypothetical protein